MTSLCAQGSTPNPISWLTHLIITQLPLEWAEHMSSMMAEQEVKLKRIEWGMNGGVHRYMCSLLDPLIHHGTSSLKFFFKVSHCSFLCDCSINTRPNTFCSKRHSTIELRAYPWWESPDNCCKYDLQIAVSIIIKCSRDCKWPSECLCLFRSQHACVPQGSIRHCLISRKAHLNTSRCWRTQKRDSTKVKHANPAYKYRKKLKKEEKNKQKKST